MLNWTIMVPLVSFLAALRILTEGTNSTTNGTDIGSSNTPPPFSAAASYHHQSSNGSDQGSERGHNNTPPPPFSISAAYRHRTSGYGSGYMSNAMPPPPHYGKSPGGYGSGAGYGPPPYTSFSHNAPTHMNYPNSDRGGGSGPGGYSGYGSGFGMPPYGSFSNNAPTHMNYLGGGGGSGGAGGGMPHPQQSPPSTIQQIGSGFGTPYNHGFTGAHNSLNPPPYPAQQIPDRCKFASVSSMASNAAAPSQARFTRIGFGSRLKSQYIFKVVKTEKQSDCEKACLETRDFICRSFNFRNMFPDNCELSYYDSKQFSLDNPTYYEQNTQFDFYERQDFNMAALSSAPVGAMSPADCMEVTQTCTPDGMEFTLKTPEGFFGRIHTYGFYDSCFYDGNGGTTSVLRISRTNGFPRCGTQQYGDAMTNIVVVQFNDYVQTSRDKKYNLTCYFSGPGEAVVTSNYLDTKTDGRYPTQIEHLPAQNILTSNVVLRVLYRGTPTNTIVVGDLLTFRLEARGQYRYDYYNGDIFATNVIAKDPYTGRQVHLIDSRGCPVDLYVFPELHKTPDGGLEAEFYAFKIPDSNFLVFQATVRTCRGPCESVICTDRGRGPGSFPSWGRRKRSTTGRGDNDAGSAVGNDDEGGVVPGGVKERTGGVNETDVDEEVHELLRVFLSREDIPDTKPSPSGDDVKDSRKTSSSANHQLATPKLMQQRVCLAQSDYYALIVTVTVLMSLFVIVVVLIGFFAFSRSNSNKLVISGT